MSTFAEHTNEYLKKKKKKKNVVQNPSGMSFSDYTKAVLGDSYEDDDIAPVGTTVTTPTVTTTKKDEDKTTFKDVANRILSELPSALSLASITMNGGNVTVDDWERARQMQESNLEKLENKKWAEGWLKESEADNKLDAAKATGVDATEDNLTGIVGMGETFVDWLAGIAPVASNAMYYQNGGMYQPLEAQETQRKLYEEQKKAAQEFASKDLYDENAVAKKILSSVRGAAILANNTQSGGYATKEDWETYWELQKQDEEYLKNDMERYSVLDEKADSLMQASGQLLGTAALQGIGVPWFVTTGATSMGAEFENASKQGATYEEALMSSAISAGAEILTEKISGGISFGGKTLDDLWTDKLARTISNKIGRSLLKFGADVAGEGFEEVVSQFASNIGTSLYSEKSLDEILFSEEALDEYIDSFVGGAILGGGSSAVNTVKSVANNTDVVTGRNNNEQTVIEKVYNDTVADREADGKKLTNKEKKDLYDATVLAMEKGYITTDTIESVLGGDEYTEYKSVLDNETSLKEQFDALQKEHDELNGMVKDKMTGVQQDRLAELKKTLPELQTQIDNYANTSNKSEVSQKFYSKMQSLLKDTKLNESYNEMARRKQTYEADLSKYSAKQQVIVQKAIDSGFLNNTNRTHDFVDLIAKIYEDKDISFDFTDNAKLKNSSFAVEGKQVNGFVDKDGNVTLNIDSAKALESVVGHEVSHVLEGTELYNELKDAVRRFANAKGEYASRIKAAMETYKGMDADIEAEVTADLIGDYLFTDNNFLNRLSVENQTLFQKIWDEIKYLCRVATAGSKEARRLEEVQRAFEKAYRDGGKVSDGKTNYSLGTYSQSQIENWSQSKKILVYQNDAQLMQFVNDAINNGNYVKKMYLGKIEGELAERIKNNTGLDFEGRNAVLRADNVRKIIHGHGDSVKEANRGQVAVTADDFLAIRKVFGSPDSIKNEPDGYYGKPSATFEKVIGDKKYTMFVVDSGGSLDVFVQTMYAHNKNGNIANVVNADALALTSETSVGTAPNSILPEKGETVKDEKVRHSLSDSNYNVSGKTARFTDARIDRLMKEYGASNEKYAQAYVTSINPRDFLKLTLKDVTFDEWNQAAKEGIDSELYPLDVDKLSGYTQTPYLSIDSETGEVVGHEGRHRMRALLEHGVTSVPITIVDYGTKYSKKKTPSMTLTSQDFGDDPVNNGFSTEVKNLIPTNNIYRDEIISAYGGDADIRFSLSKPVEETRELMALHNLHSNELLKQLEMGGIVYPSVAITKPSTISHDDYGEISLILNKDAIDPKTSKYNKIYGADAYTPTFPRVYYETSKTVSSVIGTQVREHYNDIPEYYRRSLNSLRDDRSINDELNSAGGEQGLIDRYSDDYGMKELYLAMNGEVVQMEIKRTETEITDFQKEICQHIIDVLGSEVVSQFRVKNPYESPMTVRKQWFEQHGEQFVDAYADMLVDAGITKEEAIDIINGESNVWKFGKMRMVSEYIKNGGKTIKEEFDYSSTEAKIDEKIPQNEYKAFSDGAAVYQRYQGARFPVRI